jgi:hypothetical protein
MIQLENGECILIKWQDMELCLTRVIPMVQRQCADILAKMKKKAVPEEQKSMSCDKIVTTTMAHVHSKLESAWKSRSRKDGGPTVTTADYSAQLEVA